MTIPCTKKSFLPSRPLRKNTYIVQKSELEAGGDLATTGSYEEPSVAAGPSKDRESDITLGTKQVWPRTYFFLLFAGFLLFKKPALIFAPMTPHWEGNCSLSFLPTTPSSWSQTLKDLCWRDKIAFGTSEIQGHCQVYHARCGGRRTLLQQLTWPWLNFNSKANRK